MQIKLIHFFPLFFVLLTGCQLTGKKEDPISLAMSQLIIAEPLEISYQSQAAINRLSSILYSADITEDQRAKFFFDRGVIYDSVGLRALARLDFNRAIRLKPDYVEAYNFLGIQYLQLNEFSQAYDAFDSALELKPDHEYAYLNRGTALYYGGRSQLAVDDLVEFYKRKVDDPYRIIWLYLAQVELDPVTARTELQKLKQGADPKNWATQIIRFYAGDIDESQLIKSVTLNISTNRQLVDRLCEVYFYLGKYHQLNGSLQKSAGYFKLALSTNVYEFVEHRYAKLELDRVRESIKALSR